MTINRVEILRDQGESLFVGPGAFGIIPVKGAVNRRNLVLKHRIPLDGSVKVFTSKGIAESFPENGSEGIPSSSDAMDFFMTLYDKLRSDLPDLSQEEIGMAFRLLDFASAHGRPLEAEMKNLSFNVLYLILSERCRAMMRAVFDQGEMKVRFSLWGATGTTFLTCERMVARLSQLFRDESVPSDDRLKARRAVFRLDRSGTPVYRRSPRDVRDCLNVIEEFRVDELLYRYRDKFRMVAK